jgi:hypothetical protein
MFLRVFKFLPDINHMIMSISLSGYNCSKFIPHNETHIYCEIRHIIEGLSVLITV